MKEEIFKYQTAAACIVVVCLTLFLHGVIYGGMASWLKIVLGAIPVIALAYMTFQAYKIRNMKYFRIHLVCLTVLIILIILAFVIHT